MTAVYVAIAGAACVAGISLVVLGLIPQVEPTKSTRSSPSLLTRFSKLTRRKKILIGLGALAGLAAFAITGWPLMILVVPVAVIGLPLLLADPVNKDLLMLQSLDRWIRGLATSIPTGKGIPDAIRATSAQAPALLAPEVTLLTQRLDARWPAHEALMRMADGLDAADADACLAALVLASQRGGTGATASLIALSESIQDKLRAMRDIEVERAKPRVVVRQVTIITIAVLGAAVLFGGDFFAPYGTPLGQLILAILLFCYAGSLLMLRRKTVPRKRERVLQRVSAEATT